MLSKFYHRQSYALLKVLYYIINVCSSAFFSLGKFLKLLFLFVFNHVDTLTILVNLYRTNKKKQSSQLNCAIDCNPQILVQAKKSHTKNKDIFQGLHSSWSFSTSTFIMIYSAVHTYSHGHVWPLSLFKTIQATLLPSWNNKHLWKMEDGSVEADIVIYCNMASTYSIQVREKLCALN